MALNYIVQYFHNDLAGFEKIYFSGVFIFFLVFSPMLLHNDTILDLPHNLLVLLHDVGGITFLDGRE